MAAFPPLRRPPAGTGRRVGTRAGNTAEPSRRPERAGLSRRLASLARRPPLDAAGMARIGGRYIYILPTGTGLLLGMVLVLMLLGSLNYQNNLALLFTFLLASVAVVGMLHTWLNLLDLRIAARGGPPVFAGEEALFSFVLEDDRNRMREGLEIRVGKQATVSIHPDRDAASPAGIALATSRRGWAVLDTYRLETRYPLGLFRAWSYPRTDARVLVYPRPARKAMPPPWAPALRGSEQGDLGTGADDYLGPRDYRPGDSPRRVDWKALARAPGLTVKQFGGDRAAQVWIDWDQVPAPDTESRLSMLCRLVLDAAERGLSFGLRLPGTTLAVGQGETHRHRCLAALARFEHG